MADEPRPSEPRLFLLTDGSIGDEIDALADEVRLLEQKLALLRWRLASMRGWRTRREGHSAA
jgi:hypothetical protein